MTRAPRLYRSVAEAWADVGGVPGPASREPLTREVAPVQDPPCHLCGAPIAVGVVPAWFVEAGYGEAGQQVRTASGLCADHLAAAVRDLNRYDPALRRPLVCQVPPCNDGCRCGPVRG